MKRNIVAILAFLPGCVLAAQGGGVYATNYAVGLGYSDVRDASEVSVVTGMSVPVYNKAGLSLSGMGWQRDSDNGLIDSSSYSLAAGLFLRDYSFGKIGLSTSYSKTHLDSKVLEDFLDAIGFSDRTLTASTHSIYADYYFDEVTLGLNRSMVEHEYGDDGHLLTAALGWYWQENTQFQLQAGMMDAKDTYRIGFQYQPTILKNTTSVHLVYEDSSDDELSISINYYFDTQVSLKDRDRKYR